MLLLLPSALEVHLGPVRRALNELIEESFQTVGLRPLWLRGFRADALYAASRYIRSLYECCKTMIDIISTVVRL